MPNYDPSFYAEAQCFLCAADVQIKLGRCYSLTFYAEDAYNVWICKVCGDKLQARSIRTNEEAISLLIEFYHSAAKNLKLLYRELKEQ